MTRRASYRLLGIGTALAATLQGAPAPAETCRDILTAHQPDSIEDHGVLLWVSQRAFAGELDPACGEREELLDRMRCRIRPSGRCTPAYAVWNGPGAPPDTPETRRLRVDIFRNAEAVFLGVVVETEPGLTGFGGKVETRVRGIVTEALRVAPEKRKAERQVAFLVDGGRMRLDGEALCSEFPVWARNWQPGEAFLVAGNLDVTNDPELIVPTYLVLRVADGRAYAPENWSEDAGSLDLEEIRAAFEAGAFPPSVPPDE